MAERFIAWAQTNFDLPVLTEFLDATPTAELEPLGEGTDAYKQSDEVDMGMSYAELSVLGRSVDIALTALQCIVN